MRQYVHTSAAVLLAGVMSLGAIGCALAGADDSGTKAFFTDTGPGAAGYAIAMPQGSAAAVQAPTVRASTGAAERQGPRPRVAAARTSRAHVVAVARHETAHSTVVAAHRAAPRSTVVAAHRAAPHGTMHAMHREPGAERGQS